MRANARTAGLLAVSLSVVLVGALHIARSGLSPASHRLSEYAIGPFGWVMIVAFLTLGAGLLALSYGSSRGTAVDRSGALLCSVAGIGMLITGVFRTGVSPWSESIHSRASAIATVCLVAAVMAPVVGRATGWKKERMATFRTSVAIVALGLLPISVMLHDTEWKGLGQRLLWGALLTALMLSGWGATAEERA